MSVIVNSTPKKLFSRWKWLYSSLAVENEEGQKKPAVDLLTPDDIEHYGPSNNLNKINWLSFSDLEANVDLMDSGKAGQLRAILDERYHYNTKKQTNSTKYVGNTIVSIMCDFEYATVMCQCGTKGIGVTDAKKPCSKWKYCDRCSNTKRRYAHEKYSKVFKRKTPSYFITLTLADKVKFIDGNREQIIHNWDKLNGYVDAMYKNNMIVGGIRCEELSIDRLYPVTIVNPHLHVLCHGIKGLQSHEFDGIKIDIKRVKNQKHWDNSINYVYKSMNLYDAYVFDWNVQHGEIINRNLRDCIENHKFQIRNRNQARAFGTFHAKSKNCSDDCIKNVVPHKNKALQKGNKKINYTPKATMYENLKEGVAALTTKPIVPSAAIIKVAFGELQPAPPIAPKKEEKPWYKNPWILGGGALAGAGALYGGGKLYNGGDNIVNNTFGKGVDNYIVNPIKGLFGGQETPPPPAPKPFTKLPTPPPLPTPVNRYWQENLEIARDPRYTKLQAAFQDREANLNEYLARLRSHNIDGNASGTNFEGTDPTAIQAEIDRLEPMSRFSSIDPQTFKSFINDKTVNPEVAGALNTLDVASPDKFYNWLNAHPEQLSNTQRIASGVNQVVTPLEFGDLGVGLAGTVISPFVKIPGMATATKITGALAAPLAAAGGGLSGYHYADSTGGNIAQHTLAGAAAPVVGAAVSKKLLTGTIMRMLGRAGVGAVEGAVTGRGIASGVGALTGALAYPITQQIVDGHNRAFEENMANMQKSTTLLRQFHDGLDQLNKYHNPLALAGLRETNLFKQYTADPSKYMPAQGEPPTSNQLDHNSLAQLMYLKNSNIEDMYNKSMKDIVAAGKAHLGIK